MALTVIQKPDQTKRLIPAYSDIIFVIGNGQIAGNFRHKYVLKIYSNPVEGSDRYLNGNKLLATLKTPANSDGNGVFNIAKILQDNVETGTKGISTTTHPSQTQWRSKFNGQDYDDAPHSIHQVDGFCGQRKMIRRFYVAYQEEFATTSTGAVTLSGTGTSPLYGVFNGVLQLEDGFEGFDYTPYILSSAARKFMSTQPSTYTRKWRSGDFGVISFLNGQFDSDTTNTSLNSQTRSIRLQFFNSSHALLNTIDYPINSSSLGGTASVGNTTAGLNTIIPRMYDSLFTYRNINCIQSVGIGFNNIEIRNGVQTGTSYYTIHAINSVGSQKSVKIKIQLTDEDCKGLETIRLAYVNTLGTWDYFNFYKKSTRKSEIKRSYYRSNYGDYGGATTSQGYTQSSAEGGKRSFATNVEEVIEANTDFLTEVEVGFMKELFTSPQVYMQVGQATSVQFVPVCVEEKEYIKQTTANDMLKQYIIEVRKGHKTRVQGL
tara:strand:+ start:1673 stop:3139 length:1467 start_codon:yes stop_codon:yes gene_type:complete